MFGASCLTTSIRTHADIEKTMSRVMLMSELELQKLQKKYGETTAVRKVDLILSEPKYCCLLGPSGCGKTSLLRMIAGHEVISSGSVLINGPDISEKPPSLRPT